MDCDLASATSSVGHPQDGTQRDRVHVANVDPAIESSLAVDIAQGIVVARRRRPC